MIENIESKLFYLFPEHNYIREKRGLINGLGSIVKAITGNLDADDAIKFEQEISSLKSYAKQSQQNQKLNIGIMENFMKNYESELKKIHTNQHIIAETIVKINNNISDLSNRINLLQVYVQLENNFQQIYDKISLLEIAITFASLNNLHPSIVDPNQLLNELIQVEKDYKLPFAVNRFNIHHLETTINIKAYSTANSITFILEIPIVSDSQYDVIHLYSIPNEHNMTRIPPAPYLILGSKEYA